MTSEVSAADTVATAQSVADGIAEFIAAQGVTRVFSLPGGHMKPIWDRLQHRGIRIISARHEVAAVHMAQAEADLNHRLAVAIVTTGPGLTNAVTGLGCAYLARSPLLVISTRPPRQQTGMGALEEVDQASIVAPVCRGVEVIDVARHLPDRLDRAVSTALGDDAAPGPVYIELSTDLLRQPMEHRVTGYPARTRARRLPDPDNIRAAAELIEACRRPLVLSGRDVLKAPGVVEEFVAQIGAVYLDTRASKDALSTRIPAAVPAARRRAMAEADLVITIGKVLDFEVGYGSPAVFRRAEHFLRIGRTADEVSTNRRGDVEVRADVDTGLRALLSAGAAPQHPDDPWRQSLIFDNRVKVARLQERLSDARGRDATEPMHPYALLGAVNEVIDSETIVIVDGGDILSWARSTLDTPTYLDLGAFGCLGVGVPFAVSASLNFPDRRVVAVVGDGALGFNVMELETAVRVGAKFVVVVANNSAYNIERADQELNYDGRIVGTELSTVAFDRLARALGLHGYHVDHASELSETLKMACANAPALVNVRVSGLPTSPDTLSGLASVPDLHALVAWDESERLWLSAASTSERKTMSGVTVHQPPNRESPRGYVEATSASGAIAAISGQLPAPEVLDAGGDFVAQFVSAMQRFGEVVRSTGANVTDIMLLRIYVTDIAAYQAGLPEFARQYRAELGGQFPATTLVGVSELIDPRAKVEIEGLAVLR